MSYKVKLPYLIDMFDNLNNGVGLFPFYELLKTYCSREFYDNIVKYLRCINSDILLKELVKIEDDDIRNNLTDLLT